MDSFGQQLYAVVTGDVVESSKLSKGRRKKLQEVMVGISEDVQTAYGPQAVEMDLWRGDSWQMIVSDPAISLRLALFCRAALRSRMEDHHLDVRMALAIGTIDFIPNQRLRQGDGQAFRLSGKALDSMSSGSRLTVTFPGMRKERALEVVVRLIDALASGWTDRQALAMTGALQGWTQSRIAKNCWKEPITQQAVAQHLDRASWGSVEVGIQFFEETVRSAASQMTG